jgi:hypothetical protein
MFHDKRFADVLIDNLDEFDDAPVSSTKRGGGGGGGGGAFAGGSSSGVTGLYPCSICHRSFASDRIQHHEEACKKAHKERRVFDSTKQRLQGTEAAAYFRKGKGGKGRSEPAKPEVNLIFFKFKFQIVFDISLQNPIGDKNMKILFELFVMLNKRLVMKKQVGSPKLKEIKIHNVIFRW